MKYLKYLLFLIIPFILASCSKPSDNDDKNDSSNESTTEEDTQKDNDDIDWEDEIVWPNK